MTLYADIGLTSYDDGGGGDVAMVCVESADFVFACDGPRARTPELPGE